MATLEQANDAARITDVARLLTEHREWTLAIDCYRRLAQLSPKDTEILMQLAYTLANAGHMKWAFEVYRSVLTLNPTHLACRKNMCVLLFTAGHLQEALRWAKQLEAIAPADPEIAYFLGEIHAELDESAPSIQAYRAAVEQFRAAYRFRDPDTATLIKIARCLIALGDLAKAGQCLKQVLVQAPVLPVAHFQMGQLFERMGQPDNALRAYRHCLKIAPDHTETLMAYSTLMAEKGRLDRSAWVYRRLLRATVL